MSVGTNVRLRHGKMAARRRPARRISPRALPLASRLAFSPRIQAPEAGPNPTSGTALLLQYQPPSCACWSPSATVVRDQRHLYPPSPRQDPSPSVNLLR